MKIKNNNKIYKIFNIKSIKKLAVAILPLLAFFLFWQVGSGFVPRGVISSPTKIATAMWAEFLRVKPASNMGGHTLLGHTLVSLSRIAKGFSLAASIGIVLGFLLGSYFKFLEKLLLPFFHVCEKLNPFAIIPVFMIIFGIGDEEKIAIVFWAAFWPILFNTEQGAKSVGPSLIRAAEAMGADKLKVFLKVLVPSTIPSIFTGLKIAIRVAFFMIIASEVVGATNGLGWYYVQQKIVYKLPLVYGSILFITLLAIIFNAVFTRLERHFLAWKEV
ncbi:MAG: ABC transporter permease [Clostridiales bacterium]|nr:ABC transporter permease [Clostridiales bacterium]